MLKIVVILDVNSEIGANVKSVFALFKLFFYIDSNSKFENNFPSNWVPQKLSLIYTVIAYICNGRVA